MKPLERIFFIACIRNTHFLSYNGFREDITPRFCVNEIIKLFAILGFSRKQLDYYLTKWCDRGFYEYGVNIEFGWFEFENLCGEYKAIYEQEKKKVVIR